MIERVLATIFSARFIWSVTGAGVFAWMAYSGAMQTNEISMILGVIVGFLFRSQTTPTLKGGE